MNITKYIALPFIILVVFVLFSCKKDELKLQKLEISSETVVKGTNSAQITVNYSYPTNLKRVDGYVSTMSSMTVTNKATAAIDGKTFVVKFQDLEANTTYYYQFEYSNGIDEIFTEVKSFTTNDYNTPTVTTSDVTNITAISSTCGGNVTDDGGFTVAARGVCWSTSPNPTINDSHTTDGTGIGTFTSNITGLMTDTKYYVRAYATTNKGTGYGTQKEFTTLDGMPTVTTNDVSNMTATSATCGGNVTDDGGLTVTARGVCWSTSPNPTISDSHTTDGTGTGTFTSNITGLMTDTKYYVRAYATTNKGTGYGTQKEFTTLDGMPTVTTNDVSNITATSANCGGNVTDDGGLTVTARGVCWSTSPNPTINDSHTTDGAGIGAFTSSLSNLSDYTTYYVRAYATNSKGTRYGNQVMFTATDNICFTVNGVTFEMVAVAGGTFTMGGTSEQGSDVLDNELPTHSVTLSNFHIGKYEVTQALWQAVMGSNPSYFSGNDQPVERVSWIDCQEFITQLNQLCSSQLNGKQFTLPTEAQWEYAARGGNQSMHYKYSGSNSIDDVAWYTSNSGSKTHQVGTKSPNELGIYDMSGNVWEWCQDWYGSYSSGSQTNPTGPSSGSGRVSRGGSWSSIAAYCRVSGRYAYNPDARNGSLGFRLALVQ